MKWYFDFTPLYLSLYLSFFTSVILLFISLPICWWLSQTNKIFLKRMLESFIFLPLVLPPTILGFYLLIFLNPASFIGKVWFNIFGFNIVFSMPGLIIASIVYSLPFSIQPIQIEFEKINKQILEQACMLQYSNFRIFFNVVLPLSKRGILKAFILSFSHTLGEFGVVLMIGGNIYGKTQVISIAIYESVELLDYTRTHILSLSVIIISFLVLICLFFIDDNVKN
ncbi:MAG TPA: molybdate ABC transporter permease subunit [Candidatus Azoamicus sp. MARI]